MAYTDLNVFIQTTTTSKIILKNNKRIFSYKYGHP